MMSPITYPSTPLVPTTKVAKALTMWPLNWLPLERISLVEDTLSARPKTVAISSSVGNTENSSA